jgi:hypothetical protein
MSYIQYSITAVTEMVFALPTSEWQLCLVPDDDHQNLPAIPLTYTSGQLIKSVGYLRRENRKGYHIFGRPNTCRHILSDDLCQDALDQLEIDGLRPAFVVRTSKGNYQAWVTLSTEELDPLIAASAARIIAQRYDGDPGSTDACHLGRLPGFTNRKEIYSSERGYPYTGLGGKVHRGVASGAAKLLIEAEKLAASIPTSPPYTLGACVPTNSTIDIDPSRSPMTPIEANEIYKAEIQHQAKRKGWSLPIQKGLRSQADYAVIYRLQAQYGFNPDDLAALLLYESEKAAERGMEYVLRTVNAATGYFQKSSAAIEEL